MAIQEKLNINAQAVLDVVRSVKSHPTALEVYEITKRVRPRIGLASVYRILGHLVEQDYIKEIQYGDGSSRYDGNVGRHDHGICTSCGALLDIPIEVLVPLQDLQQAAQAVGLALDTHEVRIYGCCASCQEKAGREENESLSRK